MTRKLIVTIIAIVLVIGVIGGCLALYWNSPEDVTVNINAGYQSYTLLIKNGDASGALDVDLDPFSPTDGFTTQTVDLTLDVDSTAYVDGNEGKFTVAVAGDLADYITTTVTLLDAAEGDPIENGNITAAATGAGYNSALTDQYMPIYVRLTFTLGNYDNFSDIAELTATVTIDWVVDEATTWTYDSNAYYIVGKIGGNEDFWQVNETNKNIEMVKAVNGNLGENNIAVAYNVALTQGDRIKVVWNYAAGDPDWVWYGGENGSDVEIGTTGTYTIFLYDNNGYHVSASLNQ